MKNKKLIIVGGLAAAGVAAVLVVAKKISTGSDNTLEKVTDEVVKAVNPISAEPGTALQTRAFMESLTPSLMTRDSVNQGAAAGASVLAAKGVSSATEAVTNSLLGEDTSYANKLFTRSVLWVGGYTLGKLPEKDDESLMVSGARSGGNLLEIASISGMIHDSLSRLGRRGSRTKLIPIALGTLMTTGLLYRGKGLLEERRKLIDTVPEDPANKIVPSATAGFLVLQVSRLIGFGYRSTQGGLENWLGQGPLKKNVARITNVALWGSAAVGTYWAGVSKIGQANEIMEPNYSKVPKNPNVSGSKDSVSKFKDLGLQGRRCVTDVLTKEQIQRATGKKAKAEPIRTYVGFNSDQHYHSGRAEMAMAELRRTKAFDRKYLLLVSPTGTGWIDQTMIESAELLSGGDIATCVVQYAKYPSFLALQKVVSGRRQFRQLLWSVKLQLDQMPKAKRPKLIVFGESLGAWSSSDTVMHSGIDGFDHYGIDRALWVGMPGLAKWGKIEHGETTLEIPNGTVRVFDNPAQYEGLTKKQKSKLRAIILNHDNDPIAQLRPKVLIKRPKWLRDGQRGRGVPEKMEWSPLTTFIQIAIDAGNAMRVIPGEFRSHGHDYRADMSFFVNEAYQFGASATIVGKVNNYLVKLELKRFAAAKDSEASIQ